MPSAGIIGRDQYLFSEGENKMFNHIAVAETFMKAACALAIALSTIGMGVNSSWAAGAAWGASCSKDADCKSNYCNTSNSSAGNCKAHTCC